MKATYTAPKLTVHGNVEQLTQAFGDTSQEDTIEYTTPRGTITLPGAGGSIDGIVVPTR